MRRLRVTSFDFKGIALSNLADKSFDNLTFHGVGVGRVVSGKIHNYGYIKFMDAEGDYVVTENMATWRTPRASGNSSKVRESGKELRAEENSSQPPRAADPERHDARLYPDDGKFRIASEITRSTGILKGHSGKSLPSLFKRVCHNSSCREGGHPVCL